MKGILKKGLTLGLLSLACVEMTSCGSNQQIEAEPKIPDYAFFINEGYLVVEENHVNTLHKGVEYTIGDGAGQRGFSSSTATLNLDCRDYDFRASNFNNYPVVPEEGLYEEVCDKCFPHGLENE